MLDRPEKTEALLDAMEEALPFAAPALAYQKHRAKKLKKQY